MTRNRFNLAKQPTVISSTDRRNNLTLSKAHQLFLKDNNKIDMQSNYLIKHLHPLLEKKDAVNKEYCDNTLFSYNNKTDILSENNTE